MNVIHGTWIPNDTIDFIQSGNFYLWVESDGVQNPIDHTLHPQHLPEKACLDFLKNVLGVNPIDARRGTLLSLLLPTLDGQPLPSPELQPVDVSGSVSLQSWQIYAYSLFDPLKTINTVHFLCCFQADTNRVGTDFLFWYYFSQSLKQVLAKDQYIPLLLRRKTATAIELYRRWQAVSSSYELLIQNAMAQMPLACSQQVQPESLLRHFAEVVIHELLAEATLALPQLFIKRVQDDFLETLLLEKQTSEPIYRGQQVPEDYKHWQQWQQHSGWWARR